MTTTTNAEWRAVTAHEYIVPEGKMPKLVWEENLDQPDGNPAVEILCVHDIKSQTWSHVEIAGSDNETTMFYEVTLTFNKEDNRIALWKTYQDKDDAYKIANQIADSLTKNNLFESVMLALLNEFDSSLIAVR